MRRKNVGEEKGREKERESGTFYMSPCVYWTQTVSSL